MNNLFPDFMPVAGTTFTTGFQMPGFAAAAGKYHLHQSSWAGSSSTKTITYRLFQHHGDAFMKLYTEVPQALTVSHPASISGTQTTMQVTANSGSFIALTANGEILGTATGTGGPLTFSFPPQSSGGQITVTVTKQNFFRYSAQVAVGAGGPVADFNGNPTTLIAGNQVTFTDLSTHNPTSWSWSFPGGSPATSNQKNPVVSYSTAGKYNVTLTASNSNGSTTITKTNYITVSSGVPVANFSASPTIISETASVAFTDLSTMDPVSWSWSFPGGSPSSSTAKNPVISYHTAGIYSVTLTATNSYGSNTLTKTGYITVNATSTPASANFTANITNLQTGGTVSYTDLSSGTVNSWSWSFPGGTPSSSNQQHPSVTYNTAGSYDVSLTVSNNLGSNTMTKAAYISVAPQAPVADFTASATNLIEGGQVNFTDLSINNPATWSWTFAGGTPATSTARHPAVAYYAGGSYNVTLTVSNASGSHTETRTGYITVTQAPTITYCESMGMSNSLEWIAGVNIGTFTNNSGAAGYSDFTNQVISLNPGTTYSIRLTPGFSGSPQREFWRVWIDYNGNGNFGDSGETVLVANNQRGEVTGQVSIPSNVSGTARMRVTMKGGSSPSACEIFSGGEVEDYTIDFGGTDYFGETHENVIRVYPNPASHTLNIVTGGNPTDAYLYSMDGKLLRNIIVIDHDILDLSDLRKGMYLLRLVSNEHIQVEKIIKR
jgi:PKD repeat protein